MKAVLCDIDDCRKDAHGGAIHLQYYGTASIFMEENRSPKDSILVLQTPYTHAELTSEVASIMQRPFDLCWEHQRDIALGDRIKNWWFNKDRNVQDERFVVVKMKRDRE